MKLVTLILCASLLGTAVAQAQAPAPSPEAQAAREAMRKACADDMKTLCSGKEGREMGQCMRANADKVSPACKDAMAKMPRPAAPPQ